MNPWLAIVKAHQGKGTEGLYGDFKFEKIFDYKSGIMYRNSFDDATKPKGIQEVQPFLWLLNMMSHFRDIEMIGRRREINFVRMHALTPHYTYHLFLIGCDGPFGNMHTDIQDTMP